MININTLQNDMLFNAPLKSVQWENLLTFNKACQLGKLGNCFGQVTPYKYNSTAVYDYGNVSLSNIYSTYISHSNLYSFRINSTAIGNINNNFNGATDNSKFIQLEDFAVYFEYSKISNVIHPSEKYLGEVRNLITGVQTGFPFTINNHLAYGATINGYKNQSPFEEEYKEWYKVNTVRIYNRPWNSTSPRTPFNNKLYFGIPIIATNYYGVKSAGSGINAVQGVIGSFNGFLPLMFDTNQTSGQGIPMLGILGETICGQGANPNSLTPSLNYVVYNPYIKMSSLPENVKYIGYGKSSLGTNPDLHAIILPTANSKSNLYLYETPAFSFLAFKTVDDIIKMFQDWGIIPVTSSLDKAQSLPSEEFPPYTPFDEDDTFIPNPTDETTGYPTNPIIPDIPFFPDNTSDIIPEQTPNISAFNAANVYAMTIGEVSELFNFLVTDDYTKNISELFNDKLSVLNSLRLFPFDFAVHDIDHLTENAELNLANVTAQINNYKFNPNYNMWFNGGSLHYLAYYGNYNDYINCSYSLYIPYAGIVELPPSRVVNSTLRISYAVDLISGESTCVIRSNEVVIKTMPAHIGQDVPITFSNQNQRSISNTLSALSIGTNIGSSIVNFATGNIGAGIGNIVGAATTGITQTMTNPLEYGNRGNIDCNTSMVMFQTPFLIITRGVVAPYSSYNTIGKPTSYFGNLGGFNGKGLVIFSSLDTISSATDEEQNEIRSLLNSGIYL